MKIVNILQLGVSVLLSSCSFIKNDNTDRLDKKTSLEVSPTIDTLFCEEDKVMFNINIKYPEKEGKTYYLKTFAPNGNSMLGENYYSPTIDKTVRVASFPNREKYVNNTWYFDYKLYDLTSDSTYVKIDSLRAFFYVEECE